MIVPEYWAEARVQHRTRDRQVTVRRFGWSDSSQAEAQAHADGRVAEAIARVLRGEPLTRREPRRAYNGAEGVPIREEILSRHGEAVVTRNSYGALCLNTPDVLFADVDFETDPPIRFVFLTMLGLFLLGIGLGVLLQSRWVGVAGALGGLLFGYGAAIALYRSWLMITGGAERRAIRRVERFSREHRDWSLRLYRTPAGLRVLVVHRTFAPSDPEVAELFRALRTDPVYVQMCRNQQCFRARLSAKPWRIGIAAHLRPRPGVWPITPDRMPLRRAWVEKYELAAARHSACRFMDSLGRGLAHPTARAVQQVHDQLSGALGTLPLA